MARIYHHTDPDGYCSGAIVYRAVGGTCVAINYPTTINIDEIQDNEEVWIVDFSIKPPEMEKLLAKTKNVTWIDHHISAIQAYADFKQEIKGIRDTKKAGCVLTWEFIHHSKPPEAVLYIGDYDIWKFEFKETKDFFMGLQTLKISDPTNKIWDEIISDEMNEDLIEKGKVVTQFRDQWAGDYRDKCGFETTLEGHSAYAMNLGSCGSDYFGSLIDKYDMLISFVFNGKEWNLSFYSKKVDVSKIAKKYGGGGHVGASGATVQELPFKITNTKKATIFKRLSKRSF